MGSIWNAHAQPASSDETRPFDVLFAYCIANGCERERVARVRASSTSLRKASTELLDDPTGLCRVFRRYCDDLRSDAATLRAMKDIKEIMSCPNGRKVLSHSEEIHGSTLRIIAILPPKARHVSIVSLIESPTEAKLIARLCRMLAERGDEHLDVLVERLQRCDNRPSLFGCLARPADDLRRHYARLERQPGWILLRSLSEIASGGVMFSNCLREKRWQESYASAVARGTCLLMIRPSATVPLITDIRPSLLGDGRVAQLCGVRNEPQPAEDLARASAELAAMGFRIQPPPTGPLHGDPIELLIAGVGMLNGGRAQRRASFSLRALDGEPVAVRDVRLTDDIWNEMNLHEFRPRIR